MISDELTLARKLLLIPICIFVLCICSVQSASAYHVDSFIASVNELDQEERIRRLHAELGNNPVLRGNLETIEYLLLKLKNTYSEDKQLIRHIEFFMWTSYGLHETDPSKKIEYYREKLSAYSESSNDEFKAVMMHYIGVYYFVQEMYNESFDYLLSANEIFQDIGYENIPQIGLYLHDLAFCYYTFRYYDHVKELMWSSIDFPAFSSNLDIQRYNTLGLAYKHLMDEDSALFYFKKTLERSLFHQSPEWVGIASGNIGQVYEERGQLDSAKAYYQENFDHNSRNEKFKELALNSRMHLARILLKSGDSREAGDLLKPLLNPSLLDSTLSDLFSNNQFLESTRLNYYRTLKDYYASLQNYKKARLYTDSFYTLKSGIDRKYETNLIRLSENKLLMAKSRHELELLKSNRQITLLIAGLLACALLIFILAYAVIRARQKRAEILHLFREREMALEIESKKKELDEAKKDLKKYIQDLTSKNELIEDIADELNRYRSHDIHSENEIEKTIEKLKHYRILTEEDWGNFQAMYKNVNNDLYNRLRAYTPSLTEAEIRYLLLISLQLNKKEIAAILGISPDSLRVTWNRLKKKVPEQCNAQPECFLNFITEDQESFS